MKRMPMWVLAFVAAALGLGAFGCDDEGAGTGTDGDSDSDSDSDADPVDPMGDDATAIFLHHSTGSNIWGGGVAGWIDAYNTDNGTGYAVTELAFPHSPYPWNNYPYDYWYLWVDNAGPDPVDGQETLEMLTAAYDVIIWKHCYPVSGVNEPDGSPDVTSEYKTVANYQLQYQALKTAMLGFPENRFVVWTGAAQVEGATTQAQAEQAEIFFDWVRDTWDEPGDNIYLWDFWELETEGGLYLLDEHAASAADSHPNPTFSADVAPLFARRIVDVIEGLGDVNGITGE